MELKEYFDNAKGLGVLSTADDKGRVDAAVYSRPHFMDQDTVAFIMPDRLTHQNLQTNPHAAYLFAEEGFNTRGRRLFLTKLREEKDSELLAQFRRGRHGREATERYLVFFKIDKVLPLIGAGEEKE
ncbi:MAG: pyridoxamine 5'-phosphate oxidase family protein [Proteobacteria bacterium]|nr:pyridoxamine 5'-phosphate oxidase family protein [Pseudomonadota bacterium]MBU4277583.1 pyridoxamine 5'-phosphate oxidase family protein [Pseudomonadota bacterium]MBU4384555.1 pyridoxamine 5'-phosphate oxidase family protein [Pseudomonadota bacterium]MBU4604904.1 pyridoxamine 5'-phosphate oxidase family protein [Pseudomonadota bacterium]MCG2766297.1 pyridoxamine 5'-phosphate oxidase family protein [Desulfarculaceae bacterium]